MARRSMDEVEAVRRRNMDLEAELRRSKEREQSMRKELETTRRRLQIVEEAEERLCLQLGELEAESVEQARLSFLKIKALKEQLERAQSLLGETSPPHRGSVAIAIV